GTAEIGVAFTNPDTVTSINVTAVDQGTGKSVNLGTIAPNESKTGTIATTNTTVPDGTVQFNFTNTNTSTQNGQRTAAYKAITCQPMNKTASPEIVKATTSTAAAC